MPKICHLFDDTADWQHGVAISQLLDRLPKNRFVHRLASIGRRLPDRLARLDGPVHRLHRNFGLGVLALPALSRFADRHQIDLIHSWSVPTAFLARADTKRPLVVELFDPAMRNEQAKKIVTLSRNRRFAAVCTSQTIRRRLIERGVDSTCTVVIRPGIDFHAINQVRQGDLRQQLGLSRGDFLVVPLEPATAPDQHDHALMGAILANVTTPGAYLSIPSDGPRVARLQALDDAILAPSVLRPAASRFTYEQLVAVADALVVARDGDLPTTAVAWAMGAGAVVIGPADYALAELIANKLNGLLFKMKKRESPAIAIARLLRQRDLHAKPVETARGQAFQVFGLRRFVEQHQKLYENLLAGSPPGDGITDSAAS